MHRWICRILGWLIVLACIFGAVEVFGQLPEAPKPMDRAEKALLLADAGSRALDVYSTHAMLGQGYREIILPRFVADHSGVMAVYSSATVAADWWVARRLEKKGHLKLAHVATMIDVAQDAPWAIHNLFLKRK
jgi:hypothetical protein